MTVTVIENDVSDVVVQPLQYQDTVSPQKLIAYCQCSAEAIMRSCLFELNDDTTRKNVEGSMETVLTDLMEQGLLNDFVVICDGANNLAKLVDEHKLHMDVGVQIQDGDPFTLIPVTIGPHGFDDG